MAGGETEVCVIDRKKGYMFTANEARICAGLHALLVKMLAAPDTKPENEAKSMVRIGVNCWAIDNYLQS